MATVKINSRRLRGLTSELRRTKEKLQVGWFEGAKYEDGKPVALVAAWQEYGTKTAPARPFMRPAMEENQDKWKEIYMQAAKQWLSGSGDYSRVLQSVGLVAEADIRNAIVGGSHLPLSPVTLALRRLRNENVLIGKKLVGQVAAAIAEGKTGAGELGQPFRNQDPLRETGYMISTLTYSVA